MEITKEYIEHQRAQFEAQRDQHMANAHASNGAMQACDQMLAYLEKDKPSGQDLPALDVPGTAEPVEEEKTDGV